MDCGWVASGERVREANMRRTGSWIGKYESPKDDVDEGIFLSAGMRGNTSSSSSVDASVGIVGLVIEVVDDAGSMDAMLLRIDGIDTRDSVRNDQGGESGDAGLDGS